MLLEKFEGATCNSIHSN